MPSEGSNVTSSMTSNSTSVGPSLHAARPRTDIAATVITTRPSRPRTRRPIGELKSAGSYGLSRPASVNLDLDRLGVDHGLPDLHRRERLEEPTHGADIEPEEHARDER